ncbi:hypothetical protein CENSYa_1834 [Cenarchaeum symbiosum A]|uniref:Uncharacterized protein n=1 Tax=Cenarchaeum symbiosum (strain A) TaxID=414004 RepID=A0RYM7_CENSY|nr:hypothetical protein CENSYa_1834 [Cenarchaeum symbiosum A]
MSGHDSSKFNNIMKRIIDNSLFTERQIEIILNSQNRLELDTRISRGGYYRQLGQSKGKLAKFRYTMILLQALEIIGPEEVDVMSKLSEQLSVIKDSDILSEKEEEVMGVIERVIEQASGA